MTAFDFSLVKNTSFAFNATADSLNMGAIDASTVGVSTSGNNLILTVGSDSVTLQGASAAQVSTTNVTFGSATTRSHWKVGDNTSATTVDNIANTLTEEAFAANQNNLFYGLGGSDAITAGNGNNVIFGGTGAADSTDGADTITVGSGANTVYANAGNDSIDAGTPNSAGLSSTYFLGLGNDTLDAAGHAHAGNFVIYGNTGDDSIDLDAATGDVTIFGGNGAADSTDGNDRIEWHQGSATIYGNSGNDTLIGDAITAGKTQTVFAGLGNDQVTVESAANSTTTVYGNSGDDTINGSAGAELVGNATIFGGNGIADSTDGSDTITVGNGRVTVYANSGNDTINLTGMTATGNATVFTGLGNDTVNLSGNHTDTTTVITLATGNERVNFDATAGELTTINGFDAANDVFALDLAAAETAADLVLANGFLFRDANNDGIYQAAAEEAVNFANFGGDFTATNMLITQGGIGGASVGRLLTNLNGTTAVTLTGTTTADYLVSGSLGDTLVGGGGNDKLEGNAGDDVFSLTNTLAEALDGNNVTISGGAGTDKLLLTGAAVTLVDADLPANVSSIEVIELANITGNSVTLGALALATGITTIDADAVTSGSTTLVATAFEGNLTYLGGAANDLITRNSGTGSDNFDLGAGNDTFSIDLADLSSLDTVAGGAGTDQFTFNSAGNITDSVFTNVSGFETLTLGNGANTLTGGTEFFETGITQITGNAAVDTINMSASTVSLTISGAAQNDVINGGTVADTIDGGADNDSITGAGGADNITVGAGDDTVDYDAVGDFGDTIVDFDGAGTDVFTFANSFAANGLSAGAQAETAVAFDTNEATTLTALTTAANTDRPFYAVEFDGSTLGITLYSAVDTAIANGSAATGAGFVLLDNGTNGVLLYDSDFSTTGNLSVVANLTAFADATGTTTITIL